MINIPRSQGESVFRIASRIWNFALMGANVVGGAKFNSIEDYIWQSSVLGLLERGESLQLSVSSRPQESNTAYGNFNKVRQGHNDPALNERLG